MKRRFAANQQAAGVSLFPFLAVLLCTMGALIVVLVVIARHAHMQVAEAAKRAADELANSELGVQRSELEFRISELTKSRDETQKLINDKQTELSHIEEHSRRIRDKLEALAAARENFNELAAGDTRENAELKKILARLHINADRTKAEIDELRKKGGAGGTSYAIIPYHGPNETRRRPIYVECRKEGVILQPEGILLTAQDFMVDLGPSNPLVAALRAARDYQGRNQLAAKNDSYPLFLIRPDGIEMSYVARAAIMSWGSEFGYELIGQDWPLEFPQPDPMQTLAMRQAVSEGRLRQAYLARAAPRLSRTGSHATFRAGAHGGLVQVDGTPDGGSRRGQSRPSGMPGRRGRHGAGSGGGYDNENGGGASNGPSGNNLQASGGNAATGDGPVHSIDGSDNPYLSEMASTGPAGGTGLGGTGLGGTGLGGTGLGGTGLGGTGPGGSGTGGAGTGTGPNGTPAAGAPFGAGNGNAAGPSGAGTGPFAGGPNGQGPGTGPARSQLAGTGPNGMGGPGGSGLPGRGGNGLPGTGGNGLPSTGGSGLPGSGGNGLPGSGGNGLPGTGGNGLPGTGGSGLAKTGTNGMNGTGLNGTPGPGGNGLQGPDGTGLATTGSNGLNGVGGNRYPGTRGNGLAASGGPTGGTPPGNQLAMAGGNGQGDWPGGIGQGNAMGVPGGNATGGSGTGRYGSGGGTSGSTSGGNGGSDDSGGGGGGNSQDGSGATGGSSGSKAKPGQSSLGMRYGSNNPNTAKAVGMPSDSSSGNDDGAPSSPNGFVGASSTGNSNAASTSGGASTRNGSAGGTSDTGSTSPSSNVAQSNSGAGGGPSGTGGNSSTRNRNGTRGQSTSGSGSNSSSMASGQASALGGGSSSMMSSPQMGGMPSPNLNFGQQNQQQSTPDSVAKKRGERNWANPDAATSSIPLQRSIRVVCDADHLTLLPEGRGRQGMRVVPLKQNTDEAVDDLVTAVWDRIDSWGTAGRGMYWRPTLIMEVEPGGQRRYAELKSLMADSGFDVHGEPRRRHLIPARPAKITKASK